MRLLSPFHDYQMFGIGPFSAQRWLVAHREYKSIVESCSMGSMLCGCIYSVRVYSESRLMSDISLESTVLVSKNSCPLIITNDAVNAEV